MTRTPPNIFGLFFALIPGHGLIHLIALWQGLTGRDGGKRSDMRRVWSNIPAAGRAGIPLLSAFVHHRPGLPER